MKKIFSIFTITTIFFLQITPLKAAPVSLNECYSFAIKKSRQLSTQFERIEQAEQRIKTAQAVSLPSLSLESNISYQDQPDSREARSFFPSNQTSSKIQLSVPLFKGFRDVAALSQRKYEKTAQQLALENAKRQIFNDVAQTYFTILAIEHDLKSYDKEIDANEKRKNELLSLKRLARSRDADIVTVQTAIATLEAAKETVQGQLQIAREILSFLTDLPTDAVLTDSSSLPKNIPALENWLTDLNQLPSVQEAELSLESSKQSLRQAKGEYYPSAAFNTNYYLIRPGIFSDIRWDIGVSISIPFLSKKTVQPHIKEAESRLREKEIAITQIKDTEAHAIRLAYTQFQANKSQVNRLEKAVKLSSERHRLLLQDNQQGVATNLDVLQALAGIYQTERVKDHAKIMLGYDYAVLENLTGKRSSSDAKI